jgi:hypothetical protein
MSAQRRVGPLQLLLIGFESTERFRGDVIHELLGLRGRGLLRVLDARLFQPAADGSFREIDLSPLVADPTIPQANPLARLMNADGGNGNGNGAGSSTEAVAHAAGFALDDLRALKEQIEPSELTVAVLVEHVWAAHLQDAIRDAGGRLLGQGLLTREVHMLIGDEIQARAEAETAIEISRATRNAALLDALATLSARERSSPESRSTAAADVVRVLVERGFLDSDEAPAAIDALMTAGLLEAAAVEAALAEAEDAVARSQPPPPD